MPTKLLMVDLERPLPTKVENAANYDAVWVIVMRHSIPVGQVVIDNCRTPVLVGQLRSEIVHQLGDLLLAGQDAHSLDFAKAVGCAPQQVAHQWATEPELADLLPELVPKIGHHFFLSIVVCTRDRPQDLRICLESLVQLNPGRHRLELIVVDNNPASGQTKAVLADFPQVRYEMETRPGVAYGRNQGLIAAQGDIVAYIDDDVQVSSHWSSRILAPFADERVMCVSGLVLPLELENHSQEMFEKYGALGRGYKPRIFDEQFFNRSRKHVVHTWDLGGTANVAIRKSVLPDSGMFDETLGPGQPTGVGEDIYMFYRILKAGHICYYEPAAYVWHKHRASMKALRKQLYNYNKGQTSYQLRTLVTDGDRRAIRQLLWDLPKWHGRRIWEILRGRQDYSLALVAVELWGMLVGFYAFYQANKMHRQLNGSQANPIGVGDWDRLQKLSN
jgi:glycosyltransferase involved in cell wall biosynthesis